MASYSPNGLGTRLDIALRLVAYKLTSEHYTCFKLAGKSMALYTTSKLANPVQDKSGHGMVWKAVMTVEAVGLR